MTSGLRCAIALALAALVLSSLSCGHDQQLVSVAVTPQNSTITGAGLELQYKALGSYVHPPEIKDITTKVIWQSQASQIIAFLNPSQPGLATSGAGCGTNLAITATVYSNPSNPSAGSVVVGTALVNVQQPPGTNPNCP
jgi:hypothetical protein